MIHLCTEENPDFGFCGTPHGPGNFCTVENPRSDRDWSRVCSKCKVEYDLRKEQEAREWEAEEREYEKQRAARPFSERFHDKMERLAYWDEGSRPDFYLIPYLMLAACTLGLSIPILYSGKLFAKWYLKITK